MFNPLVELRPDPRTGGRSLFTEPNIQSITMFNEVSFIFINTTELIYGLKPKRVSTLEEKRIFLGFFANTAQTEAPHFLHAPPPPELFPVAPS